MLVEMYADIITSMATTMALEIIRADLEKDSEEKVKINYYSLVQAVAKFKKKARAKPGSRKPEFKDAHELNDKQKSPGTFTLNQ